MIYGRFHHHQLTVVSGQYLMQLYFNDVKDFLADHNSGWVIFAAPVVIIISG
jgi:hypothetical protein